MANKKTGKNVVSQDAIRDGQSLLTPDAFRGLQSQNAELTRSLDDAKHATTIAKQERDAAIAQRDAAEANLGKVKKNNRLTKIVSGAITVALVVTVTALGIKLGNVNNKYKGYVAPDDYQAVVDELADVKEELAQAKSTIAGLSATITNLEAQIASLQADKAALATELADVKAQLQKVNADLFALQLQNNDLLDENAKLAGQVQALLNRVADLESRLAQKDQVATNPEQPSNGNGNVSVGDQDNEEINKGDSNIDQDELGPTQPTL